MTGGRLRAGTAEIEIPGGNYALATELVARRAAGAATPLKVKTLALANDDETLALVTLDLFGIDAATVEAIHAAVEAASGLAPRQVMIVCSHTRGAPATVPVPGTAGVESALNGQLPELVAQNVRAALAAAQPASLGIGHAQLPHLVYNHRLMTRNRKAITAWQGVPPDEVLAPEGPTDGDFAVIVVRDGHGFPLCLVWSFAADNRFDPGDKLDAGLPERVQTLIDGRIGRHLPCLYLPGCGGNVSYVHDLERSAEAVASGVMAVQLETSGDPMIKLAARTQRMILPLRDYSRYWSQADIELKAPEAVAMYAAEVEALQAEGAQAAPSQVQLFQLGRGALVALPGLPFVEFGQAIKAQSPFWATVVAGNAHAYAGTVATRHAFEHGGYETWPSRVDRVGPGGGEFLVAQASDLLAEAWKQRTR